MSRRLVLPALIAIALGLTSFGVAVARRHPAQKISRGCPDWWCAPGSTPWVGAGILLTGLGAVGLGVGLIGAIEVPEVEGPERGAQPEPRTPRDPPAPRPRTLGTRRSHPRRRVRGDAGHDR